MIVSPRSGPAPEASSRRATVVLYALLAFATATLIAGAPAARAESPELNEARALIAANHWSWQADDAWLNGLTPAQRAGLRGYAPPPGYADTLKAHLQILPAPKDLPSSFDWRRLGGVTAVRNQGQCGACWDFAAMAVIESFVKIYYNQDLDLSEEQILACNTGGASCAGGWADPVYRVVRDYGAVHEDCSPYAEGGSTAGCIQAQHHPLAKLTGWRYIANDVTQIKIALQTGPVASAIDGSGAFETYGSGCYEGGTPYTNHMVEIVGWDDRMCGNQGAWICKNSWGTGWGEYGFFYIKYGAAGIGSGVTQPLYSAPPVKIAVTSPQPADRLAAGSQVPIQWLVTQGSAPTVDIWFSAGDMCFETRLATNVPNTGSWTWTVPNLGTTQARILVYPTAGVVNGYGYTQPITIIGHRLRYVSTTGSGTAPYLSPATAARTIGAAVAACTGLDTVLVAAGEYQESVLVNAPIKLLGGWNADFSQRDPALHPTRMQGLTSALKLRAGVENVGEVDGFVFHDGSGSDYDQPAVGRYGGGILSVDGSPTIRNCRFEGNRAHPLGGYGLGGGVMVHRGSPRLENCVFTGNSAWSGGALALLDAAGAVVSNCTFLANSGSDSTLGHAGGAIYVRRGVLGLSGGALRGNGGVYEGGSVFGDSASVTITGAELATGRAVQEGGGVMTRGGGLTLAGCTVRDNRAGGGGGAGVAVESGAAVLCNVRATGNVGGGLGGGVRLAAVTGGRVENCVLSGNAAPMFGGGLFLNPTGAFVVRNSVVSGNAGNGLFAGGGSAVLDYNNVWSNAGSDFMGGYGRGAHDVCGDPVFTAAVAGDYAPGLHSVCVDRGDPDAAACDPDGSRADIGVHGGPGAAVVAPPPVTGGALSSLGAGRWRLDWSPSAAPDIARYVVYRDTARVFTPTPAKLCASVVHPAVAWTDNGPVPAGSYYLIVPLDAAGHAGGYSAPLQTNPTAVGDGAAPAVLRIAAVVPNPFNPRTTVWFDVPRAGEATLAVYDLRGRLVRTLSGGALAAGRHRADWDGRDAAGRGVAAGAYIVRLAAGGVTRVVKVALAK